MSWQDYINYVNNKNYFDWSKKIVDSFLDPFNIKEIFFRIYGSLFFFPFKQAIYQKYYFDCVLSSLKVDEDKVVGIDNSPLSLQKYLFDFISRINNGHKDFFLKIIEYEYNQNTINKEEYHRSVFAINFFSDALSIYGNEFLNPEFIREAIDTDGQSIASGISNFFKDLYCGKIELCPQDSFIVGKDFANTKGSVVYANEIMELIHYSPIVDVHFSRPILIITPWINKYYVMDLGEDKSFIKWALKKGQDIFLISWANPSSSDFSFEDYIVKGGLESLNFIRKNYSKEPVNLIGYCIGGTMATMLIAYLRAIGEAKAISSVTFFAVTIDFSDAGDIVSLISDEQLERYFSIAKSKGYVSGHDVSMFFNIMRSQELIWKVLVDKYLLGKKAKPLDFLFWHSDPTNLSCKMLCYYITNMYKKNALIVPNELSVNGVKIDVSSIDTDSYFVANEKDHIVLWQNVYKGFLLLKGDKKFVLSGSGHIAGIINPPKFCKYGFKTNECYTQSCSEWINLSTKQDGSWWTDWDAWIRKRSGNTVMSKNSDIFNKKFHIRNAPGKYVLVRC